MNLIDKIPSLPDDGLKNLRANAARLEKRGSPAQRASAAALLPAIDAELSARRDAKRPAAKREKTPSASARGRSKSSKIAPAAVNDAA